VDPVADTYQPASSYISPLFHTKASTSTHHIDFEENDNVLYGRSFARKRASGPTIDRLPSSISEFDALVRRCDASKAKDWNKMHQLNDRNCIL
jgi:hypothetical protein